MAEPAREDLSPPATLTVRSRRFGSYEVPVERIVTFPDGLIGFPDARRFALLEPSRPQSPFRYLICVDLPELAFVVCNPQDFWPGYVAEVPPPLDAAGETAVLVIATIPADAREMTANLMAPLVIDCATRRGAQLVLDVGRYSTRHPLLPAPAPDRG